MAVLSPSEAKRIHLVKRRAKPAKKNGCVHNKTTLKPQKGLSGLIVKVLQKGRNKKKLEYVTSTR